MSDGNHMHRPGVYGRGNYYGIDHAGMNTGYYISCASGLPRTGSKEGLTVQAERYGYERWGYTNPVAIWFVKAKRYPDMADVIYITRLFTADEWNRLSAAFKLAMARQ